MYIYIVIKIIIVISTIIIIGRRRVSHLLLALSSQCFWANRALQHSLSLLVPVPYRYTSPTLELGPLYPSCPSAPQYPILGGVGCLGVGLWQCGPL